MSATYPVTVHAGIERLCVSCGINRLIYVVVAEDGVRRSVCGTCQFILDKTHLVGGYDGKPPPFGWVAFPGNPIASEDFERTVAEPWREFWGKRPQ